MQSPDGATILAAGQKVELTGRGLEGIRLELQAPSDQALNLGTLQGDAVGIFAAQLKHSGLIQASAVSAEGGKVVLKAGAGDALVDGRIAGEGGILLNTTGVNASIYLTGSTLTSSAGTSIDVRANAGAVDIFRSTFNSASGSVNVSGASAISLSSSTITTGGGNLSVTSPVSSVFIYASPIDTAGGDVVISGGSGVSIHASSIGTGGGDVTITGGGSKHSGVGVHLLGGASIHAGAGAVDIRGESASAAGFHLEALGGGDTISGATVYVEGKTSVGSASPALLIDSERVSATSSLHLKAVNGDLRIINGSTVENTGSGPSLLEGPAIRIDATSVVNNGGIGAGEIQLAADEIQLDGLINSGTARTVFTPGTASRAISVGGIDELGKLNLTAAELNNVSAGVIVVGGSSFTGGLTIDGPIALTPTTALSLLNAGSISQTGALAVANLNTDGGLVMLTNAGNAIGKVSGRATSGVFQVASSTELTVGTVDGTPGITTSSSAGNVAITSAGAVTLANSITSAGLGDAVTVAGTAFNNMAGAGAIDAPGGRWVVYSTDPANNAFGGLVSGNAAVWNTDHPSTVPSGNRYVFSMQPTVSVAADAQSRVYDATVTTPPLSSIVTGLVDASSYGNVFTQDALGGGLAVAAPGKNVGSYAIVQGTLAAPAGYALNYTGNKFDITPATLIAGGLSADDKVYDGTTAASLTGSASRYARSAATLS